ncbi:Wadjet anti-phage system protein JetD domain-containing protein [Promicromonospora sukumoe]
MAEVPMAVLTWARKSGPAKFFDALRRHLENGGQAQRFISFGGDPLSLDEQIELSELFGNHPKMITSERVNLRLLRPHLLARGFTIEDMIAAVLGTVATKFEVNTEVQAQKQAANVAARLSLLETIQGDEALLHEYKALLDMEAGPISKIPDHSLTRALAWKPYDSALRAAVVIDRWAAMWPDDPIPERTLLATAFGDSKSKRMSAAARRALHALTGRLYHDLVVKAETGIRLSGPLIWEIGTVAADAGIAAPWVALPARSVRELGYIRGEFQGVLLIENQETFEQVCVKTDVNERWLCIWSEGFSGKDLIPFVQRYGHLPVAACCDMDPPGIAIVQNLIDELGFEVRPVGMNPETWRRAKKHEESLEDREIWKSQAQSLLANGCPESLRRLAEDLARTGERVEQEEMTLYLDIIRTLPKQLAQLHRMGNDGA